MVKTERKPIHTFILSDSGFVIHNRKENKKSGVEQQEQHGHCYTTVCESKNVCDLISIVNGMLSFLFCLYVYLFICSLV